MSDHDVDESGTNRAWLSVLLVAGAIGLAAAATKAAPSAADAKPAERRGVLILKDRSVHDGTVLVRGGSVSVLQGSREQLFPRGRVLVYAEDFDRASLAEGALVLVDGRTERGHVLKHEGGYWLLRGGSAQSYTTDQVREAHTDAGALADDAPPQIAPPPTLACVVLTSGDVLVGELVKTGSSFEVRQDSGVKTVVPQDAVRWIGEGVKAPTADYWRLHGKKEIDSRYQRRTPTSPGGGSNVQQNWKEAAQKDPRIASALMANSQGRWGQASEAWLDLYSEYKTKPFLDNYASCVAKWIDESVSFFRRDKLLDRVNRVVGKARSSGMLAQAGVRSAIAQTLARAIRGVNKNGFPKTAHDLVDVLSSLSPAHKERAEALWKSLPAPNRSYENDKH